MGKKEDEEAALAQAEERKNAIEAACRQRDSLRDQVTKIDNYIASEAFGKQTEEKQEEYRQSHRAYAKQLNELDANIGRMIG